VAQAWDRLHPRLTHRSAWLDHDGDLPVIDGTLIRLKVDHLPGDRDPKPVWLWSSATGAAASPGPLAADDLRRPWERPAPPGRLIPARVRRGFRNIHAKAPCPAGAPKPGKPGPGRPPGSKNRHPAPRYDVGKTTRRELSLKARREQAG
jgi:hypothetical protein